MGEDNSTIRQSERVSRLLTPREAAACIHPEMSGRAFVRLADKNGVPYQRLGKRRFYDRQAIDLLLERTRKCPDMEVGHGSGGGEASGRSCSPTQDADASVEQARQIADKLKKGSQPSSSNSDNGRSASVHPINTKSRTS